MPTNIFKGGPSKPFVPSVASFPTRLNNQSTEETAKDLVKEYAANQDKAKRMQAELSRLINRQQRICESLSRKISGAPQGVRIGRKTYLVSPATLNGALPVTIREIYIS